MDEHRATELVQRFESDLQCDPVVLKRRCIKGQLLYLIDEEGRVALPTNPRWQVTASLRDEAKDTVRCVPMTDAACVRDDNVAVMGFSNAKDLIVCTPAQQLPVQEINEIGTEAGFWSSCPDRYVNRRIVLLEGPNQRPDLVALLWLAPRLPR